MRARPRGAVGPNGNRKTAHLFVKSLLGVDPPDWNSVINLSLDQAGCELAYSLEDPETPAGFFEGQNQNPP